MEDYSTRKPDRTLDIMGIQLFNKDRYWNDFRTYRNIERSGIKLYTTYKINARSLSIQLSEGVRKTIAHSHNHP
jgi:hypothetical protein